MAEERKKVFLKNLFFYEDDYNNPSIVIDGQVKNAIYTKDADLQKVLEPSEMEIVKMARKLKNMKKDIDAKQEEFDVSGDVQLGQQIAELKANYENMLTEYINKISEAMKQYEKPAQQTTLTQMPEQPPEKPKQFITGKGAVTSIARMYNIPDELANLYFMTIDGQLYIKHPGLVYMASKIGYQAIQVESSYDGGTKTWTAKAMVFPKISIEQIKELANIPEEFRKQAWEYLTKPVIAYATANEWNVKNSKMHVFLKEMAETRAINRALRLFTGYGGTSYEELPDSDIEEQ
jgi:hypothetical protein